MTFYLLLILKKVDSVINVSNLCINIGNANLCAWGTSLETEHRSYFLEMMDLIF